MSGDLFDGEWRGPEPYYHRGGIAIFHGDARDVLPSLGGAVLVTDPPYGMGYVSNRGKLGPTDPIQGDADTGLRDEVLALWTGPALVFGKWRYARPANVRHVLVWSKGDDPGTGDLSLPWGNSFEEIYVIGVGWTGSRRGNVLTYATRRGPLRPAHPTPKPIPLMADLLRRCPPGTVIDPFMGSGATLRAAKDLGRPAIGIEVDERYCQMAVTALGQEVFSFE